MPTIRPEVLEDVAGKILLAGGARLEEAALVAASLVGANLRGYDSHGVMRLADYVNRLGSGLSKSGVELAVITESAGHLAADAQWGLGQVQMGKLLARLYEKAKTQAVVAGTLRNASHVGRLGEYCEQAAEKKLVSIVTVNNNGAARRVAPPGGKAPRLGTNPIAIGVPREREPPLVIDISTSATAEGKVRVKKIAGEVCPEGWLIDNTGQPTCDPAALYDNPPGAILPLGGAQAYKGFGLALAIEILSGALSGGQCVKEGPGGQIGNCVFLTLLNPALFAGEAHFLGEVEALASYVRATPRMEGVEEIVLPGDPERRALAKTRAAGVFLDDENWNALVKLGKHLGVEMPRAE